MRIQTAALAALLTTGCDPSSTTPQEALEAACTVSQNVAKAVHRPMFASDFTPFIPLFRSEVRSIENDTEFCAGITGGEVVGEPSDIKVAAAVCAAAFVSVRSERVGAEKVEGLGVKGGQWAMWDAIHLRHGVTPELHTNIPCFEESFSHAMQTLLQRIRL